MKRTTRQARQFAVSILAILSLSVSSIAACSCSHHEPAAKETKQSCHGHAQSGHHQSASRDSGPAFTVTCDCAQPTPNVLVKAEGFKLKKHPATLTFQARLETVTSYTAGATPELIATSGFLEQRFFPSRSSRGPPVS